jgi:hypothetical protein
MTRPRRAPDIVRDMRRLTASATSAEIWKIVRLRPSRLAPVALVACLAAAAASFPSGTSARASPASSTSGVGQHLCGTVLGRSLPPGDPNGAYVNSADDSVAWQTSCAETRVVLRAWLAGRLPSGWSQAETAAEDDSYDPVYVLSRGPSHILVASCGGSGCGERFRPGSPTCHSGSDYVLLALRVSCAVAERVIETSRGAWRCEELPHGPQAWSGVTRYCANGDGFLVAAVGE